MISHEAIKKILGINESVDMNLNDMATKIQISFLPSRKSASDIVLKYADDFTKAIKELNIKIIPFDDIWEVVPFRKRFRRLLKYLINNTRYIYCKLFGLPQESFYISKVALNRLCSKYKIRKGITLVSIGEQQTKDLPMQYISSFKTNSVVTIVDLPLDLNENSEFLEHFNRSMSLFAYHMTNIIIGVNHKNWIIYNFNASHPIFQYPDNQLVQHLLSSLIPKLAAPITPHKLSDFVVHNSRFSFKDDDIYPSVQDMVSGAKLFAKTNLYPEGKKIDSLPFRESFHKLIGKLHLDNRSGMSFGYLAFQLPAKSIDRPVKLELFKTRHPDAFIDKDFFVDPEEQIYILHKESGQHYVIKIPEVWVLSLKSGANKTDFNPQTDLIKMGLINGRLMISWPKDIKIDNTYKPSFDTKVILAHALANTILAQAAMIDNKISNYVNKILNVGYSISHWHGYFNKQLMIRDVYSYGYDNPHVSCSSPQSAIYAFEGKYHNVIDRLEHIDKYSGDIHVEPHHGINVSYDSLVKLAEYIINNPEATKLGNKFLH